MELFANNKEYKSWITNLKLVIKQRQLKAAVAVNSQLILLYWELGKEISEKQERSKWGSGFIDQLSKDLKAAFPETGGFSSDNLRYCKVFYKFYAVDLISEQPVRELNSPKKEHASFHEQAVPKLASLQEQVVPKTENEFLHHLSLIPWGHHIVILKKNKELSVAKFYVTQTIKNNWSRSVLENQIETNLYQRQGKAITNFHVTLPQEDSDLANELLKDPCHFDFLSLSPAVKELELEKKLVQHITEFLLELGKGFAYLGRQFTVKAGSREFKTDLLFYHIHLRRYVIIDLKMSEFEPEHAGKMNFYINTLNETVKGNDDKPAIGIVLCKTKDNVVVDFSLKDIQNPIGISSFTYQQLPDDVKAELPTPEQWNSELKKAEHE
jgi:predicted nuclease of restriction endonuclease-like (RecB) superfamily